ncbi:MAG: WHG domain-containing protein [Myxococcales bacterium]|nr:WHG domain-containing protein [Myxococcales bacterium]
MARRKGRSLTRKDVVQAAMVCLQEAGEEGLGVKYVAQQLGIKPPSLYNHVEGHQDIRRLVAIEGWKSQLTHLSQHEKNPSHLHLARQMKTFATQNAPLYAVMSTTTLSPQDPEYLPIHQAHQHFFSQWFQKHHKHTPEQGEQVALALRSFVHGYCLMHLFGQHHQEDQSFDYAIQQLFPSKLPTHPKQPASPPVQTKQPEPEPAQTPVQPKQSTPAQTSTQPAPQSAESQSPEVQKPVVQKPVVQKPVVQKPAAQKPAAQKPVAQKPQTQHQRHTVPQNDFVSHVQHHEYDAPSDDDDEFSTVISLSKR